MNSGWLLVLAQIGISTWTPPPIPEKPVTTAAEVAAVHARVMRGPVDDWVFWHRRARPDEGYHARIVPNIELPYYPDALTNLVVPFCSSPLVVLGRLGPSETSIAENGSEIFETRPFHVEEVIRDNPRAPAKKGSAITVLSQGGTVLVDGQPIFSPAPFVAAGRQVLVLYKYIPATGAYTSLMVSFYLRPAGVEIANYAKPSAIENLSSEKFLEAARTAATRCTPAR
jgi:hypothetical protein